MRFKHLIPLLFFLVTWNEYKVAWTNERNRTVCGDGDSGCWSTLMVETPPSERTYEVHLTTHTQRLERQIDVDRFIGGSKACDPTNVFGHSDCHHPGIISPNAFNIKVKEVKEE